MFLAWSQGPVSVGFCRPWEEFEFFPQEKNEGIHRGVTYLIYVLKDHSGCRIENRVFITVFYNKQPKHLLMQNWLNK